MSDYEEAKKWLKLGFETHGLQGMMDMADAMGIRLSGHPRTIDREPPDLGRQRKWPNLDDYQEPYSVPYLPDQLAATRSDCIEKCYQILERWLPFPGSDRNTWDFHKCVTECMGLG